MTAFSSPYFSIDPESWAVLRTSNWAYEVITCDDWAQAWYVAYNLWVQGFTVPGASDYQGVQSIGDLRSDGPFCVTWPESEEERAEVFSAFDLPLSSGPRGL